MTKVGAETASVQHVRFKELPVNKLTAAILILATAGCGMKSLDEQTKKSPDNIMDKKTDKIAEFDPKAGAKVSDSKIHATDPITSGTSSYGPMLERISKSHIEQAVNLFHANEDRYPKDLDEFMELIIKPNKIQLPVLPGGKQYQYDVENHKLVVVDAPAAPKP
jgi:hypothetical protein